MTSELSTGWLSAPFEQELPRLPDPTSDSSAEARIVRMPPSSTMPKRDSAVPSLPASRVRGGLKARLRGVDVVAVTATWLIVGTCELPATVASRRWAAAFSAIAVTLVAMQLLGLYRSRLCAQRSQQSGRIMVGAMAGALTFEVVREGGDHGYAETVLAAGSCVLAVIVMRWGFEQWLCAQRARDRYLRGVVLIGTNDDAVDVWTMLRSQPELGYRVRGIIGSQRTCPDWENLPMSRCLDDLPDIARETGSTGVLVVANALSTAEMHRVIDLSTVSGLHVQVCPGFRGVAARRVRRLPLSGEAFLYVEPGSRPTWQCVVKKAIDKVGAVIGLVVTAPLLIVAWIAIRIEGGGPVVYRQVRVGMNGQQFVVYKFRSMTLDAEEGLDATTLVNSRTDGPLFKAACDPRVTRVGAVIRALSIDELPQLFNVLTGTMSLVGPRPALPREVAQFDPELLRRHCVKPGLTGLWQLEARDNPSFHAYRRLDILYVDNWSIGLDLVILLATVPMVIMRGLRIHRQVPGPMEAPSKA